MQWRSFVKLGGSWDTTWSSLGEGMTNHKNVISSQHEEAKSRLLQHPRLRAHRENQNKDLHSCHPAAGKSQQSGPAQLG